MREQDMREQNPQRQMLKIQNMKKMYGAKTVLDIDSFEFEQGKIYAVIGSNGSGKSTLLKLISKNLKSDSKNTVIDAGNQKICYMPQKNYAFKMSTLGNVLIPSKHKKADTARALELMKALKIDDLAKSPAKKLSGGETARMALCRTLLTGAPIILLDEPTAAMDIESTKLSEKLIQSCRDTQNATVILVTHSVSQARRIADVILFMKDGRIIEHGTPTEILDFSNQPETKEFLEFFSSEV